jgi:hypothetical protein
MSGLRCFHDGDVKVHVGRVGLRVVFHPGYSARRFEFDSAVRRGAIVPGHSHSNRQRQK